MSIKKLPTLDAVRRIGRAVPKKPATAAPKPAATRPRERPRTRKKREATAWVRPYVFRRERDLCRLCGPTKVRPAESRHEIQARGAGGLVSPENSIAVCGSGTTGCHGFAQTHNMTIVEGARPRPSDPRGAEGELLVTPTSAAAAAWLGVPIGTTVSSRPRYRPFVPHQ